MRQNNVLDIRRLASQAPDGAKDRAGVDVVKGIDDGELIAVGEHVGMHAAKRIHDRDKF